MKCNKENKLTRKYYERLINIYDNGMKSGMKKNRYYSKKRTGGSIVQPETVMLAHLMSSANRNVKQQQAVVDSLNENQVCQIGKFLKQILNAKHKLPRNQIKQLIRDRNLIDAIITGRGSLSTRKNILKLKTKNQKGKFLSALLPVALSLAGPTIKGLGSVFKKIF